METTQKSALRLEYITEFEVTFKTTWWTSRPGDFGGSEKSRAKGPLSTEKDCSEQIIHIWQPNSAHSWRKKPYYKHECWHLHSGWACFPDCKAIPYLHRREQIYFGCSGQIPQQNNIFSGKCANYFLQAAAMESFAADVFADRLRNFQHMRPAVLLTRFEACKIDDFCANSAEVRFAFP
jgi:hypothetical protein